MKVYQSNCHVYLTYDANKPNEFAQAIMDRIADIQAKGLQVEIQYKPIYFPNQILFTALILGYTEE